MGFALLAFAVLLAAQTYNLSYLWGNPLLGAVIWPTEHPNSVRARQMASAYWMMQGNVEQAEVELVEAAERNPSDALLLLSVAQLQCLNGKDPSYLLRKFQSWTDGVPPSGVTEVGGQGCVPVGFELQNLTETGERTDDRRHDEPAGAG